MGVGASPATAEHLAKGAFDLVPRAPGRLGTWRLTML